MRIGLVTSAAFPHPAWRDSDSPLVLRHLDAELVPWDTAQDWTRFDGLVLQSPWSMWQDLDGFARWLDDRKDTPLLNPPDVVRMGSDKRYLATVAGTVPTTFIAGNDVRRDLTAAFPSAQARRTIVVKPIAAGGSMGAREFRPDQLDEAVDYVESHGRPMLVQPYIEAIDTYRELGVLTLNGEISHAITKAPILKEGTDERAFHPDPRPHTLTEAQRAVVMDTYESLFRDTAEPLSVRLDFIIDPAAPNGLLLLEVEMVAPVKFFGLFPDQCRRYAEAITGRLG